MRILIIFVNKSAAALDEIRSMKSDVRRHFVKKCKDEAKCLKCQKVLKCGGGSTSTLKNHLKNVHKLDANVSPVIVVDSPPQKKQKLVHEYTKKKSMEEQVAKLACVDGISFATIAKSEFIQENLKNKKYDKEPPASDVAVQRMVMSHFGKKRDELISYFKKQVAADERFSITLDEYTSLQNKRCLNINVHEQTNHWSMGFVSIKGSFTSERVEEAVRKKLNDFGLNLNKHIVCCTTDGASVMMKFGRAISSEHQHCNAHLLHLAICDVLYAKSSKDVVAQRQSSEENTTNAWSTKCL